MMYATAADARAHDRARDQPCLLPPRDPLSRNLVPCRLLLWRLSVSGQHGGVNLLEGILGRVLGVVVLLVCVVERQASLA